MFHKTSTQLAGLYLAVMMAISLFFSINVYQLSVQEFDRGFRGQGAILRRGPDIGSMPSVRDELHQEQESRYSEAKSRVLNRLIIINLIILVGGGFLSYYLARRTLKPVEQAHESLERFTADASHELRTPIAAMQTEVEVALMNPKLTLTQAKDQLKSNLEELAKLTTLSEGLLRLAHMENNILSQSTASVEAFVNNAISRVAPAAKKKQIVIHNKLEHGLHTVGDEAGLTEALITILDNAVKYSPAGSEVNVLAHKDRNLVAISIQDQGRGIQAAELPHIFDRFYRADSSRSKQTANGYGLGLAIAKNIIERHMGSIDVTSQPGAGTIFTIFLPSV